MLTVFIWGCAGFRVHVALRFPLCPRSSECSFPFPFSGTSASFRLRPLSDRSESPAKSPFPSIPCFVSLPHANLCSDENRPRHCFLSFLHSSSSLPLSPRSSPSLTRSLRSVKFEPKRACLAYRRADVSPPLAVLVRPPSKRSNAFRLLFFSFFFSFSVSFPWWSAQMLEILLLYFSLSDPSFLSYRIGCLACYGILHSTLRLQSRLGTIPHDRPFKMDPSLGRFHL